jgi:hypothetical protein
VPGIDPSQVLERQRVMTSKTFLLSPASLGGVRGRAVLGGRSSAPFMGDLRGGGVPLGDVYAFISSLYFRGKLAYAGRFARPPAGVEGVWVITPTRGLIPAGALVTLSDLEEFASGSIDADDIRYRDALRHTAERLCGLLGPTCAAVLLGSIASSRYLEPLVEVFGDRLVVPETFAGRGDMSRGGLMLRCVDAGEEMVYVPAVAAVRHGARPPKLDPRRR